MGMGRKLGSVGWWGAGCYYSFGILIMYLQTNRKTHENNNNIKKNRHNIYLYMFYADVGFSLWFFFVIHTHTHTPHSSSVHFFMLILRWLLLMCRFFISFLLHFHHHNSHPQHPQHSPAHFKKQTNKMNWKYDTFVLPILWSHKQRFFFTLFFPFFPWQKELQTIYAMLLDCQIYTHIFSVYFAFSSASFNFPTTPHFPLPCRPSFF